jgi:DNA repair exonuclease SbcCD ATPase subunit|tara:strand:+ start:171 stop:554 length:384 start_codon:yes stop_codon:yes gene_type:complete
MAEICPVCTRSISFITKETIEGINLHVECIEAFLLNPEKYGGKAIEKTEAQINLEKEASEQRTQEIKEHQKQQQRIEDKSVYVKGFSMPFDEMIVFMVKWAIASIPAFIILAIIGAILVAIFGALFF